jgi:hypothetical protein
MYFIYDSYHSYNSPWNGVLARLDNKQPTDNDLIIKIIEANLEYQQIVLKEDIVKKYSKYFRDHYLLPMKAKIDYLNNLKTDDNQYVPSVINQLQHATYIQLCHYNKSTFLLDEEITVSADIKNVQKMQVKIF